MRRACLFFRRDQSNRWPQSECRSTLSSPSTHEARAHPKRQRPTITHADPWTRRRRRSSRSRIGPVKVLGGHGRSRATTATCTPSLFSGPLVMSVDDRKRLASGRSPLLSPLALRNDRYTTPYLLILCIGVGAVGCVDWINATAMQPRTGRSLRPELEPDAARCHRRANAFLEFSQPGRGCSSLWYL